MSARLLLVLLLTLTAPAIAGAYETDQFNNRQQDISDSTSVMNHQVTLAIASTITSRHGKPDPMKIVDGIYKKIGGKHWVDKLERFAMDSGEVERLDTPPHDSIYSGHPFYATRVAGLFGVGPTLKTQRRTGGYRQAGSFPVPGKEILSPLGQNGR